MTAKKQKKHKLFLAVSLLVLLLTAVLLSVYFLLFNEYSKQKKNDLALISSAAYDGIFCTMFPLEYYSSEAFSYYCGLDILTFHSSLRNTSDVSKYLSGAFASGNEIKKVYIGLEPNQIWKSSRRSVDKWNTTVYEDILSYAVSYPDTSFEVFLPSPSMEYWLEFDEEETKEILTIYRSLAAALIQQSNITTFFSGAEEWLISNPANYYDHTTLNAELSEYIALANMGTYKYKLTSENLSLFLTNLEDLITETRNSTTEHPDLSNMDIVFFGDSIIGNYTDSSSVPNVISALSQARTYNCAQGGLCATNDFLPYIEAFFSSDLSEISPDGPFTASLERYLQDDHSGRQLVFVLNFGLNDYFGGWPVDTEQEASYAGSLREGIRTLRSKYPEATFVLMAPTYTTIFNYGTEIMSEKGDVLTEYVDATLEVADEMGVICLNNYYGLGINKNNMKIYSDDWVHLNCAGRFLLSQHIIEALAPTVHQ